VKKEKKKKREKRVRVQETTEEKPEQSPEEAEPEKSPLQYAVSLIGGKWKLRILWVLRLGEPVRYREIRQQIPGITDMMLSQSLRELAAAGFVERRQFQEIPPKVEYCITSDGQELMPAVELICAWAEKRMKG
jgi:DNA-binding HxlR family transcriptional regulator